MFSFSAISSQRGMGLVNVYHHLYTVLGEAFNVDDDFLRLSTSSQSYMSFYLFFCIYFVIHGSICVAAEHGIRLAIGVNELGTVLLIFIPIVSEIQITSLRPHKKYFAETTDEML